MPVETLGDVFPAQSVTYYAAWTAKSFPVVFDLGAEGVEGADAWAALTAGGLKVTYGRQLPELVDAAGAAMAAPKRTGYAFGGWYATVAGEGADGAGAGAAGVREIPYYTAVIGEAGTTWTPVLEGGWTGLDALTEVEGVTSLVLKAKWVVRISGSVPASIEFAIDPATMTAQAQSGVLKSFTPEAVKLEQVNVEQDAEGLAGLFGDQIDMDVKLNMSATAGGDRVILAVPENQSVTLDPSQLMSFTIPAWDGGEEPSKLNVTYSLDLGQNVTLGQIATATKFAEVYYVFALA